MGWQQDSERIRHTAEIAAKPAAACVGNRAGSVLLVQGNFGAFEGRIQNGPYARIGHSVGARGHLYCRSDLGTIDCAWLPGAISLTLPQMTADCRSSAIGFQGLAVDLGRFDVGEGVRVSTTALIPAASSLQRDPLISAVLAAMWLCAEAHGESSAFFEHGVAVILRQLAMVKAKHEKTRPARVLQGVRLQRVRDLVESRLGSDLSVAELAVEAGQDSSSFTQSFRVATGYTPFAYLTLRRMEQAKVLLAEGMSVTLVALSVGYANPSKFAAAFRRFFGCSPRQWQSVRQPSRRSCRTDL
jgi:AraC family transcriptional regulator